MRKRKFIDPVKEGLIPPHEPRASLPNYVLICYPIGTIGDSEISEIKEIIKEALAAGKEILIPTARKAITVTWQRLPGKGQDIAYCADSCWSGRLVKEWSKRFVAELELELKKKYDGKWKIYNAALSTIGTKVDPNSFGTLY